MRTIYLLFILGFYFSGFAQTFNMQRDWGTYFGDERFSLQDRITDSQGNLYITGYIIGEKPQNEEEDTTSESLVHEDYDYFENALHQNMYAGGLSDGFIAKFSPSGALLWATFVGGEGAETIKAITVDQADYIYIFGLTTSSTGIATTQATQPEKAGAVDLFLAKFTSDGEQVWGTYYGDEETQDVVAEHFLFDLLNNKHALSTSKDNYLVHDQQNSLYVTTGETWALNFEINVPPTNGKGNKLLAKFSDDGLREWSTHYGISGLTHITGVAFCNEHVYLSGFSMNLPSDPYFEDLTYYGSEGAYQTSGIPLRPNSFVAKFNSDGLREWGTYYNNKSADYSYGKSLACKDEKLFHFIYAGKNMTSTLGAYQTETDETTTPFLTRFDDLTSSAEIPHRNWATFYGMNGQHDTNNFNMGLNLYINLSESGNIYVGGSYNFFENITSQGAWAENPNPNGGANAFAGKFDEEGNFLDGTYYPGDASSNLISVLPHSEEDEESFYISGITLSNTGMASEDGLQTERIIHDPVPWLEDTPVFNIFIAHFSPVPLSADYLDKPTIKVYPNPNSGSFVFSLSTFPENMEIALFDILGKKIYEQKITQKETEIKVQNLSEGIYILKVMEHHKITGTHKIIIEK